MMGDGRLAGRCGVDRLSASRYGRVGHALIWSELVLPVAILKMHAFFFSQISAREASILPYWVSRHGSPFGSKKLTTHRQDVGSQHAGEKRTAPDRSRL